MATIRKRNGKYQVQVRRQDYPDITKTFYHQRDAKEWARLIESKADRGELTISKNEFKTITLEYLVQRYLLEVVPRKRGARDEAIVLNAFLRHPICNKKLGHLNSSDFATYRDERLTQVSSATVRRQLNPIQNMFQIARDEWGIPIKENPLSKLKLKGTDNRRERRLKEGEFELLIAEAQKRKNPYIAPVIQFAIETGMRRGEILSLQWDQVDLNRHSVTILESKNGYSRRIPLSSKGLNTLINTLDIQKGISNGISTSLDTISEQIVSPSLNDNCISDSSKVFPVTPNALRLTWGRMLKDTDIKDLHFHDLRHEAISRFFELGLTVPEVASISGHRDMRMLMRYAHSNDRVVYSKLNKDRN